VIAGHYALWQAVLLLMLMGLCKTLICSESSNQAKLVNSSAEHFGYSGGVLVGTALCCLLLEAVLGSPSPLSVGAHYYSWFPENWKAGTLGARLKPPVVPREQWYLSEDEAVFDQHVASAKEAGLDFFVFDWWPKRPAIGRRVYNHVIRRKALGGLKFALQYESLDLKEDGDRSYQNEEANVAFLTDLRAERLKKHWEYIAMHYMSDENYLRIQNKPVLFVYASRHLVGPVGKAIHDARRYVEERTGHSLFLVGDEVFFNVLKFSQRHGLLLQPEHVPNWDRIAAFDAITAYNPYDASRKEHGGAEGAEQFLQSVAELYSAYRGIAATSGVRFFPGILPGYNDRGVRLKEDHFVVPRRLPNGGLFFEQSIRRWGVPNLDRLHPVIAVTSWNEWNEDTQIEPAIASAETRQDDSENGSDYTQGEQYWGYDNLYLDVLSKELEGL
jgi:hypothetical protein